MTKEKQLIHHTILYAVANFGSSLITFFMLPIYTRYFHPEDFGVWDVAATTVGLLVPLITVELTSATYRWLIDDNETANKAEIISTGFFQILLHTLLFNFIALIIFLFIDFTLKWETLFYINVFIFSSFIQQCARGLKRNVLFASLGILQTLIVAALNIVFIFVFQLGIELFFYANIIAGLISIVVGWYNMRFSRYIRLKHYSKVILRPFFRYALPIVSGAAGWWILTMADRWMIALFLGMKFNGIYAVAVKIPAVLMMINHVFSLAWKDSAILAYRSADRDAFYSKIFDKYFTLLATSVICLTLSAKPLIEIFIGGAYNDAWKYTGILLLAALFNAMSLFWSAGFHGAKRTKTIFTTTAVGATVNVGLNLLLIPFFELYGVSIATLAAFFVTWAMRVKSGKQLFTIKFNYIKVILLLFIIVLSSMLPFIIGGHLLNLVIFVSFVMLIFVNRVILKKALCFDFKVI